VGDKAARAYKVNVHIRHKEKIEGMPAAEFVERINGLIAEKKPAQ
jgi:threonyl-tRNA synthetase